MANLRTEIIHLAQTIPDTRKHLIPVLRKTAQTITTKDLGKYNLIQIRVTESEPEVWTAQGNPVKTKRLLEKRQILPRLGSGEWFKIIPQMYSTIAAALSAGENSTKRYLQDNYPNGRSSTVAVIQWDTTGMEEHENSPFEYQVILQEGSSNS